MGGESLEIEEEEKTVFEVTGGDGARGKSAVLIVDCVICSVQ